MNMTGGMDAGAVRTETANVKCTCLRPKHHIVCFFSRYNNSIEIHFLEQILVVSSPWLFASTDGPKELIVARKNQNSNMTGGVRHKIFFPPLTFFCLLTSGSVFSPCPYGIIVVCFTLLRAGVKQNIFVRLLVWFELFDERFWED